MKRIFLAIAATLAVQSMQAGQPAIPGQAAYIEKHVHGAHFLGAVPDTKQTGVRWHFYMDPGFNQNYPSVPVSVYTWPNVSLNDFIALANTSADSQTDTLDNIKAWESANHHALFYSEDKLDYR
jgi:hypothetical protein